MSLKIPKIMGILNITPDSFYSGSRVVGKEAIQEKVKKIIAEGADIIDVGGCSTRPGSEMISAQREYDRIAPALEIIRDIDKDFPVSVDTFSSYVAIKSIENWKIDIINDISGGEIDPQIWEVAADFKIPYILTHYRDLSSTINDKINSEDVTPKVITHLAKKISELHLMGVNDVIIDPGFGFAKTTRHNFRILNELQEFARMGFPLLVGISRKSMIYKTIDSTPEEALEGTVAMEAIALEKGADILRVHDVKTAKDLVKLHLALKTA